MFRRIQPFDSAVWSGRAETKQIDADEARRLILARWELTLYSTVEECLIKMAVIHYQFESIHPFYDGNGRTGRIINILYLVQKKLLDIPVLYLSRYIIEHKAKYYRLLRDVRVTRKTAAKYLEELTAAGLNMGEKAENLPILGLVGLKNDDLYACQQSGVGTTKGLKQIHAYLFGGCPEVIADAIENSIRVKDFLPPLEELVPKEDNIRVTINIRTTLDGAVR